jgi:2-amino-4-hydroxy-6-hydroxymethyldihydropteridine diphosphokinase
MHKAYLLVGGNVGNRQKYLQEAGEFIGKRAGKVLECSAIYETAAWGKTDQASFLNQVLAIETALTASGLMTELLQIEEKIGRKRGDRYGPRIIDIDILLFDKEVHNSEHIKIPHPEMTRRRFALVPLAEIAPQILHPISGKTIKQLLEECPDSLSVQKI